MEFTFYVIAALVVLILIWTVWQLRGLSRRMSGGVSSGSNFSPEQIQQQAVAEVLSDEFLNQLRNQAQLQLSNTITGMNKQLQGALRQSYQQLLQGVEREATQIINGELEEYRQAIREAKSAAENVGKDIEQQLSEYQLKIEEQVQSAVREEKQRLLAELDTKLADVISHYLLQALGEGVDLGAQGQHILAELEAHKEDIKRDMNDEF